MIAMTRRRVLFGLLLPSAALACFAGWLWIASGPRVTRERFRLVKKGMTREEAIRTVGVPPGNYSGHRAVPMFTSHGEEFDEWFCDGGHLVVVYDFYGNRADFVGIRHFAPPTFTERIRRWLGL
jgi:hypothetical protein